MRLTLLIFYSLVLVAQASFPASAFASGIKEPDYFLLISKGRDGQIDQTHVHVDRTYIDSTYLENPKSGPELNLTVPWSVIILETDTLRKELPTPIVNADYKSSVIDLHQGHRNPWPGFVKDAQDTHWQPIDKQQQQHQEFFSFTERYETPESRKIIDELYLVPRKPPEGIVVGYISCPQNSIVPKDAKTCTVRTYLAHNIYGSYRMPAAWITKWAEVEKRVQSYVAHITQ